MSTEKLLGLSSLAFGALLLAGAGCVGGTTTTSDTTTNTTTVAVDVEDEDEASDDDVVDTDTAIEITSPEDGDTVTQPFNVEVAIDDFTLAPDKVEGANVEGEGHYHVWVDGEYFVAGVAEATEIDGLEAGEHELMVSLQNNDHTDLAEPVQSGAVTVTVE
ncbi:MAG: hypothetical protein ACD_41C00107G0001 [uncultured bacterium]|nr:MAG: hypothetical protein ACD_41C00107G0001 [uncultured bacterium]HBY74127.1 hypothetical protein [Candidatus Kerfeldbacteria bacterium]